MEEKEFPSREEMEKELLKLREVSASIDKLSLMMAKEDLPPDEINKLLEDKVREQSRIVDRFIQLSSDRETLQKFTKVVSRIQSKTKKLETVEDRDEYVRKKAEILQLIEEWIECLEKIIIGVIEKASTRRGS